VYGVMPETDADRHTAGTSREIPTIEPEKEPEYVGAHSALAAEECQNWVGETTDDVDNRERGWTGEVLD